MRIAPPAAPSWIAPDDLPAPAPATRWRATAIALTPAAPRDPAETRTLAERLHGELVAGADPSALARRWSDDPSGRRGGDLGVFLPGTFHRTLEAAVASVAVGEVAPAVQDADGTWWLAVRTPTAEVRVRAASWGVTGARAVRAAHSDDEARAAAVAWSEDPTKAPAPDRLDGPAWVSRRQWPAALESVAWSLEPGTRSEPVRLPWGWVVVERLAAE